MDDFIRRQFTYRRAEVNPMLRIERVWREIESLEPDNARQEPGTLSDGSDLEEIEEVDLQTHIPWIELTILQRIEVLHLLCEWHLQSDKFREKTGSLNDLQMTSWRVLPIGMDSNDRLYYFMSDDRLYSCLNPSNLATTKAESKKRKRGYQTAVNYSEASRQAPLKDDWRCIATTLDEWQEAVDNLDEPLNSTERQLRHYLEKEALPVIAEQEALKYAKIAAAKAKAERIEHERIKEMLRAELLATRKRSSRIQVMDERRKEEEIRRQEVERIRALEEQAERSAARNALALQANGVGISARLTREGRAKERELREHQARTPSEDLHDSLSTNPGSATQESSLTTKEFAQEEAVRSSYPHDVVNSQGVQHTDSKSHETSTNQPCSPNPSLTEITQSLVAVSELGHVLAPVSDATPSLARVLDARQSLFPIPERTTDLTALTQPCNQNRKSASSP